MKLKINSRCEFKSHCRPHYDGIAQWQSVNPLSIKFHGRRKQFKPFELKTLPNLLNLAIKRVGEGIGKVASPARLFGVNQWQD